MPRRWPVAAAGWESRLLSPWREAGRRRAAWFGLIAAVVLAHVLFGARVIASVIGWNGAPQPRRIEITFSRPVQPTAPLPAAAVAAPSPPAAPRPARAVRSARASSAPVPASAPETSADTALSDSHAALLRQALALAAATAPSRPAASAAEAAASAVSDVAGVEPPPAAANTGSISVISGSGSVSAPVTRPSRPSFEWPPSTRLTYTLTGLYRNGPLYGKASVEWRRSGLHYQVQFDIHVSPFFDQHMFSDGQITDQGLSPRHYDESFEVPLMAPRVRRIDFSEDEVTLANGSRVVKLPQTQDGASQFVQFVWMFAQRPELLRPGNIVDIPLALNSNLRRWHYQVAGVEPQSFNFGQIDAVHLRPVLDGPRRPNEYPFEIWTAPTLQYLPVRILVPIDDKNFADLSLDALPMQAAAVPEGDAASEPMRR
jgi:hypothetical protein